MKNKILKQIAAFTTALTMSLGLFTLFPEGSFPQLSLPVFAETTVVESGQCGDNVLYELDSEGTLTISGEGKMYEYSYSGSPFYNNSYIKKVIITSGVTSIGRYAFYCCYNLTSITIPDSVTSIGNWTFYYCESLTSITIPDGVTSIGNYAFANCESLISITIPDGVTSIGNYAFNYCESLTSITIPDSVISIGDYAFANCESLISITIPDGVTSIGDSVFEYCKSLTSITIPEGVTIIGDSAFEYCKSLTSITIPKSVTYISQSAITDNTNFLIYGYSNSSAEMYAISRGIDFYALDSDIYYENDYVDSGFCGDNNYRNNAVWFLNSDGVLTITGTGGTDNYWEVMSDKQPWYEHKDNITEVIIEEGITKVGDFSFYYCSNIKKVSLPESLIEIWYNVFANCQSLISIQIPSKVDFIGWDTFSGCESLTNIIVDSNNMHFMSRDGVLFTKDGSELLLYPNGKLESTYTIPEGTTVIGTDSHSGFRDCSNLTSITIPDSVTSIDDYAFSNCESLTSITIPDGVTSIKSGTFWGCTSLTSIIIPNSVTSIYGGAFENCENLTSITIPDGVTSISQYAFSNCSSLTNITIPNGITSIEDWTFYGCTSLVSIIIPNSVTSIHATAFDDCNNLTIYGYKNSYAETYANENNIPFVALDETETPDDPATPIKNFEITTNYDDPTGETYKIIGYNGTDEDVVIPEICADGDITSIYQFVFSGNTVKSVTISENITSIDTTAFSNATALENIYVNENNTTFKAQDGVLYNYDMTKLLCYPEGKTSTEVTVSDTVETIGSFAFNNIDIDKLVIGKNVTAIEQNAFFGSEITIYGYKNSYAETYANENNIPFVALDGESGDDEEEDPDPTPTPDPDECEHNYSTTYSYNASGHWYECTSCYAKQAGSQSAHSFGDSVVTKEPTETENGVSERHCKYCDYIEKTTLAATGDTVYVNEGETYTAEHLDINKHIVVNGGTLYVKEDYSFKNLTVNSGYAELSAGDFTAIGVNGGQLTIRGDVTVNGSVYVVGGEGKLFGSDVKGGTMIVSSGTLVVTNKLMISEYGVFSMNGGVVDTADFELSTKYDGSSFVGGTLYISSSFTQKNKAFTAGSNHNTVFYDDTKKVIDVDTDELTFGNLYLTKDADVYNNLKNVFYAKNILGEFALCSSKTNIKNIGALRSYLIDFDKPWEEKWTEAVTNLFDSYSTLTIDSFTGNIKIVDKDIEEAMVTNVALWSSVMKSEVARKTRDYSTANVIRFEDIDIKLNYTNQKADFYFYFGDVLGAFKDIDGVDLNVISYRIYVEGIKAPYKGTYSISAGTNQYEFAKSCMKHLAEGYMQEILNYLNIPSSIAKTTTQELVRGLIQSYFAYDTVDSAVEKAQAAMTLINPQFTVVSSWEKIVKCPVDVYVYDQNNALVASVIDNEVYDESDKVIVYVENDAKHIHGFEMGYTVKIVGNGTGTMDVEYNEYDEEYILVRHTEYEELPVTPNYVYTSDIVACNSGILVDNTTISTVLTPNELYSEVEHNINNVWNYNSTSHWHECSCGEKTDIASHTFDNGTIINGVKTYSCTVCGYNMRTENAGPSGSVSPSYPISTPSVKIEPEEEDDEEFYEDVSSASGIEVGNSDVDSNSNYAVLLFIPVIAGAVIIRRKTTK